MWDTCVSKRHGIHKGGTGRTGGGIKAIISYLLTGMPEVWVFCSCIKGAESKYLEVY